MSLPSRAWVLIGAALLLYACAPAGQRGSQEAGSGSDDGTIAVSTGEPELRVEGGAGVYGLMTAEEFAERAESWRERGNFVDVDDPHLHGIDARYLVQSHGDGLVAMAITGDTDSGFEMHTGLEQLDDPLPFEVEDGRHTLTLRLTASGEVRSGDGGEATEVPVPIQLSLDAERALDRVLVYDETLRRGTLPLPGGEVEFGLLGSRGRYDREYNRLFFDLDGDGEFDRARNSDELYRVVEAHVTFGETGYEFEVDRYGRSLTLEPTDGPPSPRPSLEVGNPAPDFTFVDIDGNERRLSDYRGKVVMLDFWGIWCGPCHGEIPHLIEAWGRFHERGFEIVGVDYRDALDELRPFLEEKGMAWTQTREEGEDRPVHDLYRVWAWPTHYLIDEDGEILAFNVRGEALVETLEEHFREDEPAGSASEAGPVASR